MPLPVRLLAPAAVAGALLAALPASVRAEGEGTNFMEDRVAQILMEHAAAARMSVCEAVLIPLGGDRYRIAYRVARPGQPQVPRPDGAMTAVVANPGGCPR